METTVTSVESAEISVEGIEELETSINSLVEFLEQEKQQNEEKEQQQIEIYQSDLENEEQFREALLNSLNAVNSTLVDTKIEVLELKESQLELNEAYMQAVPNFYWGANALIIIVCIIPCLIIVKLLKDMINSFL